MPRCVPPAWTWEQRLDRAAELARRRPEAEQLLSVYRELAGTQALLARRASPINGLLRCHRESLGVIPEGLPVGRFWVLLRSAAQAGPEALARVARELEVGGPQAQAEALRRFFGRQGGSVPRLGPQTAGDGAGTSPAMGRQELSGGPESGQKRVTTNGDGLSGPHSALRAAAEILLAHLFVQPYAEVEAHALCAEEEGAGESRGEAAAEAPSKASPGVWCPLCGSAAQVGYLVDREGEQGGLFLLCGLCGASWRRLRLVCSVCGAEADKISYFRAEEFPHVSLDVCEGCGHYLKVVDLRKDGLAVPCVEDLASVSLDLWAAEQGFYKLHVSLAGV